MCMVDGGTQNEDIRITYISLKCDDCAFQCILCEDIFYL